MEEKRTWITSTAIQEEHLNLPIRQIYLWFLTSDNKLPIVKGSGWYQLPGGKPEEGESKMETIKREMFEETGIKLDLEKNTPNLFGYYVIENNEKWNNEPFLQIRYFLKVKESSDKFNLSVNEREDDKDTMSEVKFIHFDEILKDLPYLKDRGEYEEAKLLGNH